MSSRGLQIDRDLEPGLNLHEAKRRAMDGDILQRQKWPRHGIFDCHVTNTEDADAIPAHDVMSHAHFGDMLEALLYVANVFHVSPDRNRMGEEEVPLALEKAVCFSAALLRPHQPTLVKTVGLCGGNQVFHR